VQEIAEAGNVELIFLFSKPLLTRAFLWMGAVERFERVGIEGVGVYS
jgi:hypothetical protein